MSGTWTKTAIGKHECDLFEPNERNEQGYVVLYLHDEDGSPGLREDPFLSAVNRAGLPVIVPQGGSCWWLDRVVPWFDANVSPEVYLLEEVIPWIEATYATPPKHIGLLGDGMGGQGVLRLSYIRPRQFPVVAAVKPKIDFHYLVRDGHELLTELFGDPEAARQRTAILYLIQLNWPQFQFFCSDPADYYWFDGADRLAMKLAASGIPFDRELERECDGDTSAYYREMIGPAVDYVARHLERERLRIV